MIIKIAKWAGAIVSIVVVVAFGLNHISSSQETEDKANINEAYIEQLRDIHISQDTADEAKASLTKELCLNEKLKDKDECAKVGVKVNE
jgi:uncharacterized membrane protein